MNSFPSDHPLHRLRLRELGQLNSQSIGFSEHSIQSLRRLNGDEMRHRGCVNTLCFSSCGHILLSGSDDRYIKFWDVAYKRQLGQVKTKHLHNIFHVDFCRAIPHNIISAAADGTIRITDMPSEVEQVLLRSQSIVHMFVTDLNTPSVIYSAEEVGCIQRIDVRTKNIDKIFRNYADYGGGRLGLKPVKALAQSEAMGPSQLVVGGSGLNVGILDLRILPLQQDTRPADKIFAGIFSPLGVTSSGCPAIISMRASFGNTLSTSGLAFSKSGHKLAVSYQGDQIYLFDTCAMSSSGDAIGPSNVLGGHINYSTFLKTVSFYGHRDEYIVSGSDSAEIWIWDASSGALLPTSSSYALHSGSGLLRHIVADRYACRVLNTLSAGAPKPPNYHS